jgi:hypothetical protein
VRHFLLAASFLSGSVGLPRGCRRHQATDFLSILIFIMSGNKVKFAVMFAV